MIIPLWVWLALITSLIFGAVNILDKTILWRFQLSPWVYFALDGFIGIIPMLLILLGDNPFLLRPEWIILGLCSGVALAGFNLLYFFALELSDVSIIVLLLQTTPVFATIWGVIFLHEYYTRIVYFGMISVLVGISLTVLSQSSSNKGKQPFSKIITAAALMAAATFLLSISDLLSAITLKYSTILAVYFWQRVSLVLLSFFVILIMWAKIKILSYQPIVLTSLVEILLAVGLFTLTSALAQGPLGIVSLLTSMQPVWVVIISLVLSSSKFKILPKDQGLSKSILFFAIVFIFSGLVLMKMDWNLLGK